MNKEIGIIIVDIGPAHHANAVLAHAMAMHPNAEVITVDEAKKRGLTLDFPIRNTPIIQVPEMIKTTPFFERPGCKRQSANPSKKTKRW